MITKHIVIKLKEGFHIRPAQLFSEMAAKYKSDILVVTDTGETADAKSILSLMTLGLQEGSKISIEANGPDNQDAVYALTHLIESNFGEV